MEQEGLHLVEWLKRIQASWGLDLPALAQMTSVGESELAHVFRLTQSDVAGLPSIPEGFEGAAGLVGLYRLLIGVYPTVDEQLKWLELPNPVFEGLRPIEVIAMSPAHLAYVTYIVESGLRLGPLKE